MRNPCKFLVHISRWRSGVLEVMVEWEERIKSSSRTGSHTSNQIQNTYRSSHKVGKSGYLTITSPWSSIRVMMEFHLIALENSPVVLSVGIGDIILQLLDKCFLLVTCATAIESCGNINLCTRLGSDIEGDVHKILSDHSKA